MTSYSSYCPLDQPLKISKANGIRFVYNVETGDFIYPIAPEDNILYNEDPFCGNQTEEFQQPFPCDGTIRLQIIWCDNSVPYLGFYDTNDNLITDIVIGTNIETSCYEWDLNLDHHAGLCERCIVLKIGKRAEILGDELTTNGDFESPPVDGNVVGWTNAFSSVPGTPIIYSGNVFGGQFRFSGDGVTYISTGAILTIGIVYELTFNIAFLSGYIQIYQGVDYDSIIVYNTDGTKTIRFTATGNYLIIYGDNDSLVDNVSIKEVTIGIIAEAESEPIKVSAYHKCLTKFEYWNDDAYDNIDYSLGYKNILYVGVMFEMPKYPEESKVYLKSNGVTKKLSGRLKKLVPMKTDFIPAYLHEKMAIIFSHDNVEINGVAYVKEGEYQIDSIDKYILAQGSTDLTKVLYNYINSNCD